MEAAPAQSRAPGLALVVLCTAQLVLQLDFSIVNIALRTIERALSFGPSELQWIATGYALSFGSLLMLGGRLGDLVGRRRMILVGLWLFGSASAVCGVAWSPVVLVAARLVQGAAAALMAPAILASLTAIAPDGPARTRALSIWTAATAVGASGGVVLGGVLTQYLGWRSIFLVNLPVIATLIPLCYVALPNAPGDRREHGLDAPGAALVTLALAALIFGLSDGAEHGFGSTAPVGSFVVSAVSAFAFILSERRAEHPMIPFAFLHVRVRRVGMLVFVLFGVPLSANAYFLALYMQRAYHWGQVHAAFGLLPGPMSVLITSSLISRHVIGRIGLKRSLVVGLLFCAVAYAVFSLSGPHGHYWVKVFPTAVLNSVGAGLLFPAIAAAVTFGTDHTNRGLAGSLIPTAQQISAAVGLAILATIAAVTHGPAASPVAHVDTAYWVGFAFVLVAAGLVARIRFETHSEAAVGVRGLA